LRKRGAASGAIRAKMGSMQIQPPAEGGRLASLTISA
jgi:hypothetical protein